MTDTCELADVSTVYESGHPLMEFLDDHGVAVESEYGHALGVIDLHSNCCIDQSGGVYVPDGAIVTHTQETCAMGRDRAFR